MYNRRQLCLGLFSAVAMLMLILDAKTALSGAKEGIELCLYTVIPSLFPFMVLSAILSPILLGKTPLLLRFIGLLCHMPAGSESILALSLLGGYPVGAQCIYQAYADGQLHREDARRLLGFCNNAGPSFIFGIMGSIFSSPYIPWAIWLIHIFSAIIVGCLLPGKPHASCQISARRLPTLPQALAQGIRTLSQVCGWIVLFRIYLTFLSRWFLWLLPASLQTAVFGIAELANGCGLLSHLPNSGMQFIYACVFLAFGGFCVWMQTLSVTKELGAGLFFKGKLLQALLSLLISLLAQSFLFPTGDCLHLSTTLQITLILLSIFLLFCVFLRNKAGNFQKAVV